MPRYLVERTFPNGLVIPVTDGGAQACQGVVAANAEDGVTWIHSYVTPTASRPSVCTTHRIRTRSGGWPSATSCPSTASPRSACSIRTSTADD